MIIGTYGFLSSTIRLFRISPTRRTKKRIKDIEELDKRKKTIEQQMGPLLRIIESNIKVTKYDRLTLERELSRIESTDTVEKHMAKRYMYPICVIGMGTVAKYILASEPIFLLSILVGVMTYFLPDIELREKIEQKNKAIMLELPSLIRTIINSPENKTMYSIINDYLKISKSGLKRDLEIWRDNVRLISDEKEEWISLSSRINIPEVTNVVQTIVASMEVNRSRAKLILERQEEDIRKVNVNNKRKELKKRPDQMEIIIKMIFLLVAGLFAVPAVLEAVEKYISIYN